jgi:hypothetical protein
MLTLTIIPYKPASAGANHRSGDRHHAKITNEPQTTLSNLSVEMPQTQPTASTLINLSQSSLVSRDKSEDGGTGEFLIGLRWERM